LNQLGEQPAVIRVIDFLGHQPIKRFGNGDARLVHVDVERRGRVGT
jgi:hypothetical protein